MYTAELHTEHIVALELVTDTVQYLERHGYPVDVETVYSVVSDSDNGYLVYEIQTLEKPTELADVVADQLTLWACTCDDYRYRSGLPDLETDRPMHYEPCKHCLECRKELKAANDENQTELEQQ